MAVIQFKPSTPTVFKIRVELENSNPPVWRSFIVDSDASVFCLAMFLCFSVDDMPVPPWRITVGEKEYGHDGFDMRGNQNSQTAISDIIGYGGTGIFEYGVWKFIFSVEAAGEKFGRYKTPACVDGAGESPVDYCRTPEEFAKFQAGKKKRLTSRTYGTRYDYTFFNKTDITKMFRNDNNFQWFSQITPSSDPEEEKFLEKFVQSCRNALQAILDQGDTPENPLYLPFRATIDRLTPELGKEDAFEAVLSVFSELLSETMPPFNKEFSAQKLMRELMKL